MKLKKYGKLTTLMIVLGWLLVFWGMKNALADFRKSSSPFDDPGVEQLNDEQGFIPYLNPITKSDHIESRSQEYSFNMDAQMDLLNEAGDPLFLKDPFDQASLRSNNPETQAYFNQSEITNTNVITKPQIPYRLIIDKIELNVPIIPVEYKEIEYLGDIYQQWIAPNRYAVGWHNLSAPLGESGNTVLNGHHNVYGEVFSRLTELENGDTIQVIAENTRFTYLVANKLILKERFQSVETRIDNARWIQASDDERLTLVTCWPYESNTHRVIVVAIPIGTEVISLSDID